MEGVFGFHLVLISKMNIKLFIGILQLIVRKYVHLRIC